MAAVDPLDEYSIARNSELRFPKTLRPIHSLNRQLITLLVDVGKTSRLRPDCLAAGELGRILGEVDPATRYKLTRCPFALIDAGFRDPDRWTQPSLEPPPAEDKESPHLQARIELARSTLVLAWHLVRSDVIAAEVFLGVSEECAMAITRMELQDVQELATSNYRWIQPRWIDRPEVWHRLITLAQCAPAMAHASVGVRGLQLFLGEMIRKDEMA